MMNGRQNGMREDGLSTSLQMAKAAEHLVCSILILQGHNVFFADAGLPYDLLIDLGGGKFGRIQVKSTGKAIGFRLDRKTGRKRHTVLYRFAIRTGGRSGPRRVKGHLCDYFAFVALDSKIVAFMGFHEVVNPDGFCKTGIEFKTRSIDNSRKGYTGPDPNKVGKFMEDYSDFNRCK